MFFSISGFTNAHSFVRINVHKILEAEDWVRNELLDLIPDFFQNDENMTQF